MAALEGNYVFSVASIIGIITFCSAAIFVMNRFFASSKRLVLVKLSIENNVICHDDKKIQYL